MTKYSVDIRDGKLKVHINNILHICIKVDQLISFQSYLEGDNDKQYYIDFVMKDKIMIVEYNNIKKWKSILNLLDKLTIWNQLK